MDEGQCNAAFFGAVDKDAREVLPGARVRMRQSELGVNRRHEQDECGDQDREQGDRKAQPGQGARVAKKSAKHVNLLCVQCAPKFVTRPWTLQKKCVK